MRRLVLPLILGLVHAFVAFAQAAPGHLGNQVNILVNGNFTDWAEEGIPSGWRWRVSSPALSKLNEERLGNPVISIRQSNALYQDVSALTLREDDRIVFEGWVRTGEEGKAFADIDLAYENAEDSREVMRSPIASGGWQYIRLVLRVPRDAPANVRFAVHMREDMESPLLMSGLRAYVIPGMP